MITDKFTRLICYPFILLSFLLTLIFDAHVHANEVVRYHGETPGDFLTFRTYGILALHPASDVHVSVPFLYPPPFLLFTVPVSWLSPAPGFVVWILGASLAITLTARAIKLPWLAVGGGLLSAPNLFCAVTGQSGILVSTFLLLALGLADTAPVFSGIAAGFLIIKPQFALLLPVCFLAQKNWRAFFSAAVAATSLCAISALFFGMGVWRAVVASHGGAGGDMLAAPWLTEFQIMMDTPFVMFRSFHFSLQSAIGSQLIVSLAVAICCWRLWQTGASALEKLTPTLCLVALATPYGYIYDLPALGFALAGLAVMRPSARSLFALTLFGLVMCLYALISVYLFSAGAALLTAVLALSWPRTACATAAGSADPPASLSLSAR